MLSIPIDIALPRVPRLVTSLPGPRARDIVERDRVAGALRHRAVTALPFPMVQRYFLAIQVQSLTKEPSNLLGITRDVLW